MNIQKAVAVEQKAPSRFEMLVQGIEHDQVWCMKSINEWAAGIAANPLSAFSWSSGQFASAAKYNVAAYVLRHFKERGESCLPEVVKHMKEEVVRTARSGVMRSTSPTSNLATEQENCARADYVEKLERFIEFSKVQQFHDRLKVTWFELDRGVFGGSLVQEQYGRVAWFRVERLKKGSQRFTAQYKRRETEDYQNMRAEGFPTIEAAKHAVENLVRTQLYNEATVQI